jgi:hypothetical protein
LGTFVVVEHGWVVFIVTCVVGMASFVVYAVVVVAIDGDEGMARARYRIGR